jgi:chemotaxis signal transduction protein
MDPDRPETVNTEPGDHPDYDTFAQHMRGLQISERDFLYLRALWDGLVQDAKNLSHLGEVRQIIDTMVATQMRFGGLEHALLRSLVRENLATVTRRLSSTAQVLVDLIYRNLFERTADIGFLAADDDIRRFLLGREGLLPPGSAAPSADAIHERLKEYVSKYTVYHDVVVLSPEGEVLVRLDAGIPNNRVMHPLLELAVHSGKYVETFGSIDLLPGNERALVYSQRIDGPEGRVLGVLCLCFRFENEMSGIFIGLKAPGDRSVMLLLDPEDRVIASSDADHVRLGARIGYEPVQQTAGSDGYGMTYFSGRMYLSVRRSGRPYQSYKGMGWIGQVMVPLDLAFGSGGGDVLGSIPQGIRAEVLRHTGTLCRDLAEIDEGARQINGALARVVYEGALSVAHGSGGQTDETSFKNMLQSVTDKGRRTQEAFQSAIASLYTTVITANYELAGSSAKLAADLMDRNLYERSDDCRWWALNSEIRSILSLEAPSEADYLRITEVLRCINELYTVYPRVVVFDRSGKILASSNLHNENLEVVGTRIEAPFVAETLALRTTQEYRVSPFDDSYLYGSRPTYLYCAAIRHPEDISQVTGGISLVFDSEPEFTNMLEDCLPDRPGAWSCFVEVASGRIVGASGRSGKKVGGLLHIDPEFRKLRPGQGKAKILEFEGQYCIVGCFVAGGYREFKKIDGYKNDVAALTFIPIGAADSDTVDADPALSGAGALQPDSGHPDAVDYATFFIGNELYALAARDVAALSTLDHLKRVPGSRPYIAGTLPFRSPGSAGSELPIPVMHGAMLLGGEAIPGADRPSGEILVVRTGDERCPFAGLLVDRLDAVPGFRPERILALPLKDDIGFANRAIISSAKKMLFILDAKKLLAAAQGR